MSKINKDYIAKVRLDYLEREELTLLCQKLGISISKALRRGVALFREEALKKIKNLERLPIDPRWISWNREKGTINISFPEGTPPGDYEIDVNLLEI